MVYVHALYSSRHFLGRIWEEYRISIVKHEILQDHFLQDPMESLMFLGIWIGSSILTRSAFLNVLLNYIV